ncbi:glycine betaine ABC transporter substrate-binding protein, partial [Escherichia coli]|uniref:glycine betaine ABC transporter substrate-binding protein n=1 Tax=Escherichia coli TaxID=562 RepID=UPI0034D1C513
FTPLATRTPLVHGQRAVDAWIAALVVGDARIGLIVPEYVSANSIADLQAQKDAFGGRVVGIDAGAGVM